MPNRRQSWRPAAGFPPSTPVAMLVYLQDEKVMFMGDVIMPYLGAPFVEEGDLQGLLDMNLIPPNLLAAHPDVYQAYLILREHVIDRLYDQSVGY
jgi:hypothetical protein